MDILVAGGVGMCFDILCETCSDCEHTEILPADNCPYEIYMECEKFRKAVDEKLSPDDPTCR